MASTTFFANRLRLSLLDTWTPATVTLTTGSTSHTGGTEGDFVWAAADGVQAACKVLNGTTLQYAYRGAGGTSVSGYRCTPLALAVLRGAEFTVSYEVKELFGTDSINRVDEAKYAEKVITKIKYSKWDPGVTTDWMMKVIRPSGATGDVEETNTLYTNGVVYYILGSDATDNVEIVAGKTYWEGLPYPFPENEFVIRDVTGHAVSATIHSY